jgi:signal transduction histidine kinase
MQKIIVDFLDFHALEDGKLKLETGPCDLNEIARDLIESIGETAKAKEIEIATDLEEGLPAVEADAARIRQVAQNLVDNAVKFSPPKSHVVVLTRRGDGSVKFEVRDSGPGLSDEDFQKVFQKYARLSSKPTGGEKSSGLGLAISKQLVEVHGGEIGVHNRDEGGAAFWFRLPLTAR